MKSQNLANAILDHILGGVDYTRLATLYLGFATDTILDTDTGSTVSEPASGNYGRTAITNNSTNFPAASGGSKSTGANMSSPESTGAWGSRVVDWFLASASSAGNIVLFGRLIGTEFVFTATVADTFTAPGHGFVNGNRVRVFGDNLPTGLTHGGSYYVISVSGDTFQLSATQGGAAINLTGAGSGTIAEDLGRDIGATGESLIFNAGNLTFTES